MELCHIVCTTKDDVFRFAKKNSTPVGTFGEHSSRLSARRRPRRRDEGYGDQLSADRDAVLYAAELYPAGNCEHRTADAGENVL